MPITANGAISSPPLQISSRNSHAQLVTTPASGKPSDNGPVTRSATRLAKSGLIVSPIASQENENPLSVPQTSVSAARITPPSGLKRRHEPDEATRTSTAAQRRRGRPRKMTKIEPTSPTGSTLHCLPPHTETQGTVVDNSGESIKPTNDARLSTRSIREKPRTTAISSGTSTATSPGTNVTTQTLGSLAKTQLVATPLPEKVLHPTGKEASGDFKTSVVLPVPPSAATAPRGQSQVGRTVKQERVISVKPSSLGANPPRGTVGESEKAQDVLDEALVEAYLLAIDFGVRYLFQFMTFGWVLTRHVGSSASAVTPYDYYEPHKDTEAQGTWSQIDYARRAIPTHGTRRLRILSLVHRLCF